ncbi:hypothetical protein ACSBR1_018489 [Camellia fascicularis]
MASRALLGALVERWWDTTNSFHLSSTGEMTMTPCDFSTITGLRVRGDPIPFDMDMGEWEAAWIYLLGAPTSVQASDGEVQLGFLIFLLGTTLFANKWNTMCLYLLSALMTLPRVRFYDWGGAGLAILYGYKSSTCRMRGERLWVYAYFSALAPEPMDEIPPVIPYLRRYDCRCRRRSRDDMTFAFYRRYFNTVVADKIMWQPCVTMPAGVRD